LTTFRRSEVEYYNPREAEQVLKRWLADGGKLPGRG
jgi:hypothetical protein